MSTRKKNYCTGISKRYGIRVIQQQWTISLAPYIWHPSPTTPSLTGDGQKQLLSGFRATFPDIKITVEAVIADGDKVAFRSTMRTAHRGDFMGIAPTGHEVTVGLLDVIRIEAGKVVEQRGGPDTYGLLRQVGASVSPR